MQPSRHPSSQDACPGALTVHRADDGNLVRIRIPGGVVAIAQLRALAAAAVRIGDGQLELTSRGNVQLRGLAAGAEVGLAPVLAEVGLLPSPTHERVRNITASALTGRDLAGQLDVRPIVAELDHQLCADPELARLPGRFLFAVDDGRGDVSGLDSDVTLLGLGPDTLALLLAGSDTGLRSRSGDAAGLALAAARAFVAARDAGSPAWRIGELGPVERDGIARTAAGAGPVWSTPPETLSVESVTQREPGEIAQQDGRAALRVTVAWGRLTADQAELLARAAEDGGGEILVTPWRTVIVPDLSPTTAARWRDGLGNAGLLTDPAASLVHVTACTGRPGCGKALADVRTDALAVHAIAASPTLPVHWIGCERACGRPAARHLEVRASTDGYLISLDRTVRASVPTGPDTDEAVRASGADGAVRARQADAVTRLAAALDACGANAGNQQAQGV